MIQFEKIRFRTKPSQDYFMIDIVEGNCVMSATNFKLYHYHIIDKMDWENIILIADTTF